MQTNLGWAFGPEVSVLADELKVDGTWQISVLGRGERTCPGCGMRTTARHSWQHRRLQNLRACIESHMSSVSRHHGRSLVPAPPRDAVNAHETARQAQRAARRWLTMRAIAARTGVGWRTVAKWVRSGCLRDRHRAVPGPRSPRHFLDDLQRRWAEGCRHGRYLFWEIQHRGYQGSYSHLQKLLAEWRSASG